ncbi:hypothetical protein [Polyangium aurulentum]|uniref:hypothetical protein n=1 Tax=Polyangium aurulentum TaxID=2567896 RepID=UPI0010AEBFAA|nr:hypothetical protein [Polyangium aurulentum]UQA58390.1 hypothetical protein E8A73_045295 [Polyangium aurulentum]
MSEAFGDVLPPAACRDEATLKRFVQEKISPNAWPIHAPALKRRILEDGLDLGAARGFHMDLGAMERLIRAVYARSRRVELLLGIDNAFHRSLHNHEVLLRLLLLEWPEDRTPPEAMRNAAMRVYPTLDEITEVLLSALAGLLEAGVTPAVLARDVLAALGHDYGHSGGTDRLGPDGVPAPLTHEEMAEKHVAPVGLAHGMPPALVLESMAGIRATTFHARPGRDRIQAASAFERMLTVADVMGCALPAHLWLTHVGAPVLAEKLPMWRRRLVQIPEEIARIDARLGALPEADARRAELRAERDALVAEDGRIIKHLEEWFRSERGFFVFIESSRLGVVPRARELWGETLRDKIALMERVLERRDLLEPLVAGGFALLEDYARVLANADDLEVVVKGRALDGPVREILAMFLPG